MRSDALAKRQALVTAARRLFSDAGPDVPLRTVAAEAEVGIATLYRHFPTRDELLLGVADQIRDEILQICGDARDTWDQDPHGTWRRFVCRLAAMHLGTLATQLQQWPNLQTVASQRQDNREQVLQNIESVLALAKHDGLVHDSVDVLDFHLGLGSIARRFPNQPFQTVPERHGPWLVDIYLAGLRVGPDVEKPRP